MDPDRDYRPGQVPLPGFGAPDDAGRPAGSPRPDGVVRHARRMSNWTLAALIAGTGAATVALAHHSFPGTASTASTSATSAGAGQAAVTTADGPQVSHSVATSSGSGATVTTTTKTVNGRTVIIRTVHPAYHDN
jgi:hypothetical protein